ncbi:MAG: hypothetical protein JNN05_04650, partial [Candidatus Omnitrophica bacterium]|nr:hypothetical protein [Candidatus Omnitrophota bacterium]
SNPPTETALGRGDSGNPKGPVVGGETPSSVTAKATTEVSNQAPINSVASTEAARSVNIANQMRQMMGVSENATEAFQPILSRINTVASEVSTGKLTGEDAVRAVSRLQYEIRMAKGETEELGFTSKGDWNHAENILAKVNDRATEKSTGPPDGKSDNAIFAATKKSNQSQKSSILDNLITPVKEWRANRQAVKTEQSAKITIQQIQSEIKTITDAIDGKASLGTADFQSIRNIEARMKAEMESNYSRNPEQLAAALIMIRTFEAVNRGDITALEALRKVIVLPGADGKTTIAAQAMAEVYARNPNAKSVFVTAETKLVNDMKIALDKINVQLATEGKPTIPVQEPVVNNGVISAPIKGITVMDVAQFNQMRSQDLLKGVFGFLDEPQSGFQAPALRVTSVQGLGKEKVEKAASDANVMNEVKEYVAGAKIETKLFEIVNDVTGGGEKNIQRVIRDNPQLAEREMSVVLSRLKETPEYQQNPNMYSDAKLKVLSNDASFVIYGDNGKYYKINRDPATGKMTSYSTVDVDRGHSLDKTVYGDSGTGETAGLYGRARMIAVKEFFAGRQDAFAKEIPEGFDVYLEGFVGRNDKSDKVTTYADSVQQLSGFAAFTATASGFRPTTEALKAQVLAVKPELEITSPEYAGKFRLDFEADKSQPEIIVGALRNAINDSVSRGDRRDLLMVSDSNNNNRQAAAQEIANLAVKGSEFTGREIIVETGKDTFKVLDSGETDINKGRATTSEALKSEIRNDPTRQRILILQTYDGTNFAAVPKEVSLNAKGEIILTNATSEANVLQTFLRFGITSDMSVRRLEGTAQQIVSGKDIRLIDVERDQLIALKSNVTKAEAELAVAKMTKDESDIKVAEGAVQQAKVLLDAGMLRVMSNIQSEVNTRNTELLVVVPRTSVSKAAEANTEALQRQVAAASVNRHVDEVNLRNDLYALNKLREQGYTGDTINRASQNYEGYTTYQGVKDPNNSFVGLKPVSFTAEAPVEFTSGLKLNQGETYNYQNNLITASVLSQNDDDQKTQIQPVAMVSYLQQPSGVGNLGEVKVIRSEFNNGVAIVPRNESLDSDVAIKDTHYGFDQKTGAVTELGYTLEVPEKLMGLYGFQSNGNRKDSLENVFVPLDQYKKQFGFVSEVEKEKGFSEGGLAPIQNLLHSQLARSGKAVTATPLSDSRMQKVIAKALAITRTRESNALTTGARDVASISAVRVALEDVASSENKRANLYFNPITSQEELSEANRILDFIVKGPHREGHAKAGGFDRLSPQEQEEITQKFNALHPDDQRSVLKARDSIKSAGLAVDETFKVRYFHQLNGRRLAGHAGRFEGHRNIFLTPTADAIAPMLTQIGRQDLIGRQDEDAVNERFAYTLIHEAQSMVKQNSDADQKKEMAIWEQKYGKPVEAASVQKRLENAGVFTNDQGKAEFVGQSLSIMQINDALTRYQQPGLSVQQPQTPINVQDNGSFTINAPLVDQLTLNVQGQIEEDGLISERMAVTGPREVLAKSGLLRAGYQHSIQDQGDRVTIGNLYAEDVVEAMGVQTFDRKDSAILGFGKKDDAPNDSQTGPIVEGTIARYPIRNVQDVKAAIQKEAKDLLLYNDSKLYEIGGNVIQYSPNRIESFEGNRKIIAFHTHLYREDDLVENSMVGFIKGLGLSSEEAQMVLSMPDIYHAEQTYPRLNEIAEENKTKPLNTFPYATGTALIDKQGNVRMIGFLPLSSMTQKEHDALIKYTEQARKEMGSEQGLSNDTARAFYGSVISHTLLESDPRIAEVFGKTTDLIVPRFSFGIFNEDINKKLRKEGDLGGVVGAVVGKNQKGGLSLVLSIDDLGKSSTLYRAVPFADVGYNKRVQRAVAEKLLGFKGDISKDAFNQGLNDYINSKENILKTIPIGGEEYRVLPQRFIPNGHGEVVYLDVGLVGTPTSVHTSSEFLEYVASHNLIRHRTNGDRALLSTTRMENSISSPTAPFINLISLGCNGVNCTGTQLEMNPPDKGTVAGTEPPKLFGRSRFNEKGLDSIGVKERSADKVESSIVNEVLIAKKGEAQGDRLVFGSKFKEGRPDIWTAKESEVDFNIDSSSAGFKAPTSASPSQGLGSSLGMAIPGGMGNTGSTVTTPLSSSTIANALETLATNSAITTQSSVTSVISPILIGNELTTLSQVQPQSLSISVTMPNQLSSSLSNSADQAMLSKALDESFAASLQNIKMPQPTAPIMDFNQMALPPMNANAPLMGTMEGGQQYFYNPTNAPMNLGSIVLAPDQMVIDQGNGFSLQQVASNNAGEKTWKQVGFIPATPLAQPLQTVTVNNIPTHQGDVRKTITFDIDARAGPKPMAMTVRTPNGNSTKILADTFEAKYEKPEDAFKPQLNQYIFDRAKKENKVISVRDLESTDRNDLKDLKPNAEILKDAKGALYVLDVSADDVQHYVNDYVSNLDPQDRKLVTQSLKGFVPAASSHVVDQNQKDAIFITPLVVKNMNTQAATGFFKTVQEQADVAWREELRAAQGGITDADNKAQLREALKGSSSVLGIQGDNTRQLTASETLAVFASRYSSIGNVQTSETPANAPFARINQNARQLVEALRVRGLSDEKIKDQLQYYGEQFSLKSTPKSQKVKNDIPLVVEVMSSLNLEPLQNGPDKTENLKIVEAAQVYVDVSRVQATARASNMAVTNRVFGDQAMLAQVSRPISREEVKIVGKVNLAGNPQATADMNRLL